MRNQADFYRKIGIKSSIKLSHWHVLPVHKKKKRKMLTPGIEPGLPKPQSGVLPLYYVSFLINMVSRGTSLDVGPLQ